MVLVVSSSCNNTLLLAKPHSSPELMRSEGGRGDARGDDQRGTILSISSLASLQASRDFLAQAI
jgi:hypothetical protein